MKHPLPYLVLLVFLFQACQPTAPKEEKSSPDTDTLIESLQKESQPRKDVELPASDGLASVSMTDASHYSDAFISELRALNGIEKVVLNEELMILNQVDSISFPALPPLDKRITFTAIKGNLAIALHVTRVNYTSIDYRIELVEFGKTSRTENGTAHLKPPFFLGSESDVDDLTKESYFTTEYSMESDSCYTFIRIGRLDDVSDRGLLAKMVKNCNGEMGTIDLDNFPTLREK